MRNTSNTIFVEKAKGEIRFRYSKDYAKYTCPALPENNNYVERFDGFKTYKDTEIETVGIYHLVNGQRV